MKKITTLLVTIFTGVFSAQPVYLHFADSALVNEKVIYLGDVARVTSPSDMSLEASLCNIKIGDAAPAGFSRYMNTAEIILFFLTPFYPQVRFYPEGAKRVRNRRWAADQSITEHPDNSLTLAMTTSGRADVLHWLLSFGPHAEILEPTDMRRSLHEELNAAASLYT